MPDEIRRIDYYYVAVPDKPGEGSRILTALHHAGINLLGVSAFPHGVRRSQLDLIPEDGGAFAKAAGREECEERAGEPPPNHSESQDANVLKVYVVSAREVSNEIRDECGARS